MRNIFLVASIALGLTACDSTIVSNETGNGELVDHSVVGGKPSKAEVFEISGSGWSGTGTATRNAKGELRWKIVASGEPDKVLIATLGYTSNTYSGAATFVADSRGKLSTGWYYDLNPSSTGDERRFLIFDGISEVLIARSETIIVP